MKPHLFSAIYKGPITIWVFPKIVGFPQIIHFNRVFPYFHHPFWGETPISPCITKQGPTTKQDQGPWLMSLQLLRSVGTWNLQGAVVEFFLGDEKKIPGRLGSPKWGYSPYKLPKWLINGGY